jgi:uncharacterized ferritin-like protein (DUF455 family)
LFTACFLLFRSLFAIELNRPTFAHALVFLVVVVVALATSDDATFAFLDIIVVELELVKVARSIGGRRWFRSLCNCASKELLVLFSSTTRRASFSSFSSSS